ncbi:beta-ketoacyl synthase chain length factor [Gramella lutea]|uniref:Beta-ketoacyl synthase chain length factor n=1 Tax=Christiangramia lutea TaxID=1607951 RepID=A0A9X1V302_9FLAO|nr:beta-ketoacyl synthase chain length factor [Christiangramia lutea]MCH4823174.1 beta-ketoacyl synthase chain length factor [Christiangramia lutea]
MSRVYINGISSISPQPERVFEGLEPHVSKENILHAVDLNYKSVIKPIMLRRMSKAVKMSLYCSKMALKDANVQIPDAILVGTGQGCMQDTEKFMGNMLDSEEGLLSPTSFIQSTHNTVGGQIALDLNCTGHNLTFTQNSVSFESALIDTQLQFEDPDVENILVGGVDETSEKFTGFQTLDGQIKKEKIRNINLYNSNTPGTIISESAAFFTLGSEKKSTSYAEFIDVGIFNSIDVSDISSKIQKFLKRNGVSFEDIDVVILGRNGDHRFDKYYDEIQNGIFSGKSQLGFKHMVGENNAVSSYAFWMGAKILKEKKIPENFKLNTLNCDVPQKILIYNQYLGRNHGFILLQSL